MFGCVKVLLGTWWCMLLGDRGMAIVGATRTAVGIAQMTTNVNEA